MDSKEKEPIKRHDWLHTQQTQHKKDGKEEEATHWNGNKSLKNLERNVIH